MNRRSLAVSLVLLLIGVSVGWSLSIYAQSGTPEIKPSGISGFQWINASSFKLNKGLFYGAYNRTHVIKYPEQGARFLVYNQSGTIYWKDLSTGQIRGQGTDSDQIINWALDNLTSGRTWKERVILKGYFNIDNEIQVPSYTILQLDGIIKQTSTSSKHILVNKSSPTYDIELIGGKYIGNTAQPTGSPFPSAIHFSSVTGLDIHNIEVYDIKYFAVNLKNCSNIYLNSLFGENLGADGIALNRCENVTGSNFIFKKTAQVDAGGAGIWVNSRNVILSNVLTSESGVGVHIEAFDQDVFNVHISNVISNFPSRYAVKLGANDGYELYDVSVRGIKGLNSTLSSVLLVVSGSGVIHDFELLDLDIRNSQQYAIRVDSSVGAGQIRDGRIIGGSLVNSVYSQFSADGLNRSAIKLLNIRDGSSNGLIIVNSFYNVISENIFDNNAGTGLVESTGSDYNTIKDNDVRNDEMNINGAHTTVKDNPGFYTETSGTATISGGTSVTFNHGLAGTPTFVSASFNATGYGDWKWTATSTQITITVTNAGNYTVYWEAKYVP